MGQIAPDLALADDTSLVGFWRDFARMIHLETPPGRCRKTHHLPGASPIFRTSRPPNFKELRVSGSAPGHLKLWISYHKSWFELRTCPILYWIALGKISTPETWYFFPNYGNVTRWETNPSFSLSNHPKKTAQPWQREAQPTSQADLPTFRKKGMESRNGDAPWGAATPGNFLTMMKLRLGLVIWCPGREIRDGFDVRAGKFLMDVDFVSIESNSKLKHFFFGMSRGVFGFPRWTCTCEWESKKWTIDFACSILYMYMFGGFHYANPRCFSFADFQSESPCEVDESC